MGARFRARATLLQRECQLIVCLRIVRRKSDGLAECCDGAGEVAALELLKANADSERRSLLIRFLPIESFRFPHFNSGCVRLSGLPQHLAETQMSFRRFRPILHGFPKRGERLCCGALLFQDRSEHVMRIGVVWPAGDGFTQRTHGLVCAAGLPEDHTEGERRVGKRRVELGCAPQLGFGASEVVLLLERETEVVSRLRIRGL